MRAVIQRTILAGVTIEGKLIAEIHSGLVVFAAISTFDTRENAQTLARRLLQVRLFEDATGKMNRSVQESGASLLVVPNFTVYASYEKSSRADFSQAARREQAQPLFHCLLDHLVASGVPVQAGVFGAHMQVSLTNDGPVTVIIEG